ncbi:MAG: hypothetical protein GVY36_16850 [Verrucomicrobia bacterium]|jgi:hypothetical protein|nr:hypothetical protein [Verrucomicrobiota bacterium]
MIVGSNPHKVDSDDDGFVDKDEYESGSDPNDAAAWPPIITSKAWSRPMAILNTAAPVHLFGEVWSAPVVICNASAPIDQYGEVWSAPILVRNDYTAPVL